MIRYSYVRPGATGATRHYVGIPIEVGGDPVDQVDLPQARLVIVHPAEGWLHVGAVDSLGHYAGDTWHESLEDALHQAQYEYGEALEGWADVPRDRPVREAIASSANRLSAGGRRRVFTEFQKLTA